MRLFLSNQIDKQIALMRRPLRPSKFEVLLVTQENQASYRERGVLWILRMQAKCDQVLTAN